ncbi:MAG: prolyl oligopeptidase family serine peptidase [Bryobacteraceae bacterium]|nr:prolyl oligopeptidase family serine peptidase [Bryobacteraceae bacterium]
MPGLYAKWIDRWEHELATHDRNRQVRPFEWGADWLEGLSPNGDVRKSVLDYVRRSVRESGAFYFAPPVTDYRLENNVLRFTSPIQSPYPENNTVYADFFPTENDGGRAVVVLPQWNSDINGHVGLCKLLNKFGITALRMSKAYHDRRMPAGLERADYHMSSNVGRTISAVRQSVQDLRSCLSWLQQRGYQRLAVLGTSLGSCVAFIAAAHDERVRCGVFNHVSMNVGDVVWTGLSTQHVRKGFHGQLNQEELREFWSVISPASYMDRMESRKMPALLVWAKYDTTFLPEYSQQVLRSFRERGLPHKVFTLPCAHYTTGKFPFNWMDGLAMCRFLRSNL